MKAVWQLQDAKNRLSRVVDEALEEGPQVITRRGVETAVVLSMEDYRKLVQPKTGLSQFFKNSPLSEVPLDLQRDKDLGREVEI